MTEPTVLVIEAGRSQRHYWADLWRYRELLFFLAWRDLLVRYRQTALGVAWAVLRPLLMMLAFTVVFHRVAKLPSDGVPYPTLVLAALLPWQLFAQGFAEAGSSLVSNANLVSKVYFPRLIIPAATLAVGLVDFAISLGLLAALMTWYGHPPGVQVLALPLFVALALGAAVGAGLWTAALSVRYRDFRYVVPFVVQLGLFISPVGYSTSSIPEAWRLLYALNPMVGIIEGFRWSLLGGDVTLNGTALAISVVVVCALLVSGTAFFRRTERSFADVI